MWYWWVHSLCGFSGHTEVDYTHHIVHNRGGPHYANLGYHPRGLQASFSGVACPSLRVDCTSKNGWREGIGLFCLEDQRCYYFSGKKGSIIDQATCCTLWERWGEDESYEYHTSTWRYSEPNWWPQRVGRSCDANRWSIDTRGSEEIKDANSLPIWRDQRTTSRDFNLTII